MGDGTPLTRDQTAGWIVNTGSNEALDGWTTLAVADPDTDLMRGFAGLIHGNDAGTIEVTYAILPDHRGLGLATEAVQALTAHGLTRVTEIFATVDPANTASTKILERLGFSAVLSRKDVYSQTEILFRVDVNNLRNAR